MRSSSLSSGHYRLALRLVAAGGLATLMSGCSSDVSRLTDPFSNPFSSASNDEAPAVAKPRHVASADVIPAGRMAPVSSQALAPRSANSNVAYNSVSRETTGSIEPGPARMGPGTSFGNWTSSGGTPIVVAEGESAQVLAQRYGVPSAALLQVNGLHSAAEIRPGSRITVPVYSSSTAGTTRVAEAAPRIEERRAPPAVREHVAAVVPERASTPAGHWVAGPAPAKTASPAPGRVVTAQRVEAPMVSSKHPAMAAKVMAEKAPAAPIGKVAKTMTAPKAAPLQRTAIAAAPVAPVQKAMVKSAPIAAAAPAVAAPKVVAEAPAPAPAPTASAVASADGSPEFRWPARGRIIQGFKGGGGGNDGINIAVPEGTSVRAAEGGVVAYAGSELKGYGNLVLIRHPNGFVSAYANNGSIDVKRGETVKRGQEIAKSGQSGNVSSPQLHFELRKGSTPVDPTQFLAGL